MTLQFPSVPPQHLSVKEDQCVESLVVRGGCHIPRHTQVLQKCGDLCGTHFRRMAFAVKKHKLPLPRRIRIRRVAGVMFRTDGVTKLLLQFRLWTVWIIWPCLQGHIKS